VRKQFGYIVGFGLVVSLAVAAFARGGKIYQVGGATFTEQRSKQDGGAIRLLLNGKRKAYFEARDGVTLTPALVIQDNHGVVKMMEEDGTVTVLKN
jgi:hypothetical protein